MARLALGLGSDRSSGMVLLAPPIQFFVLMVAGWVNRRQSEVIDYLLEENRIFREQLPGRRLKLTDNQRRRLALKGKPLGRRLLRDYAGIVTPDTILRWYRRLVAAKYDGSRQSECLHRVVPLGERHLRELIHHFTEHYHRERPHQGLEGELIARDVAIPQPANGRIRCHSRLGGTLNHYYREAA